MKKRKMTRKEKLEAKKIAKEKRDKEKEIKRRQNFLKSVDEEIRKSAMPVISIKSTSLKKSVYSEKLKRVIDYLKEHNLHTKAKQARRAKTVLEIQEWEQYIYTHQRIEERKRSQQQKESIQKQYGSPDDLLALQKEIRAVLNTKEFSLGAQNLKIHSKEIENFLQNKWTDIDSIKRHFGLSLEQSNEVIVSIGSLVKLGILRIRFQQANFVPPAVGVDLLMSHDIIFPCSLTAIGKLQIPQELNEIIPDSVQLLLRLAIVMFYADIVLPYGEETFQYNAKNSGQKPMKSKKYESHVESIKLIPRAHYLTSQPSISSSAEAPRDSAFIDPFRRRLPNGQKPSFMKIIEADQFGINLQGPGFPDIQYTFVKAHVRGGGDEIPAYAYKQSYSAVKTFETLLSTFGFF